MIPLFSETEWPPIAVYDLEAAKAWVDICLACHWDELGNKREFPSHKEYITWLFANFKGTHVWAHAGGHYDHRFLLAEAHERGWEFNTAISGNSIVTCSITDLKGRTIKFCDSYRLMPDSLEKIGKSVGLPKLDVDPSQIILLSEQERLDYCFRDCEIVLKGLQLMKAILTAHGADFAYTLASIATRYIRRSPFDWDHFVKKNKNDKLVPRDHVYEWDMGCYEAYHGGRCEVYKSGIFQTDLLWYDIVSSYPAAMREELPFYYLGYKTLPSNMTISKFISYCGITECLVWIPFECHICCGDEVRKQQCQACQGTGRAFLTVLPMKEPRTGKLIFPTGLVKGTWTNIELQEAVKYGAQILDIIGQYRFKPVPFMRPFVDKFYKLRQAAKDNKDEFAIYAFKILLNSAYGKLVETIERRTYITQGQIDGIMKKYERDLEACPSGKGRPIKPDIRQTKVKGVCCVVSYERGPFRHTAAGAYVTAYARLRLFRKTMEMYEAGARPYYSDTDSLMIDREIPETGKSLGNWEFVGHIKELEIRLPKVYRAVMSDGEIKYKCKGLPIERKFEDKSVAAARWEAFINHHWHPSDEYERLLGKDGIDGFIAGINAGSLRPRRRQETCKTCNGTGKFERIDCLICGGDGFKLKPLVRALQSEDTKRDWNEGVSHPIHVNQGVPNAFRRIHSKAKRSKGHVS